jgi:membrane protein YqaA with SNARE-associated domain
MVQNFYFDVFIEALRYASPIPFSNEPTFFAMHAFANFDMLPAVFFAVVGAAVGACVNFIIGYCLKIAYLKQKNPKHLSFKQYERAKRFFVRYLIFFLFFSWLPLLNFIVFAAGFLGIRAFLALPIVIIGQVLRYGWFL